MKIFSEKQKVEIFTKSKLKKKVEIFTRSKLKDTFQEERNISRNGKMNDEQDNGKCVGIYKLMLTP